MRNCFLLALLLSLFATSSLWAQSGTPAFTITGQVKGLKDTTCVLAHYFGATQLYLQRTPPV